MHRHQNSGVAPLPENVTRLATDSQSLLSSNETYPSAPDTTPVRTKFIKSAGYVLVSMSIYLFLTMLAFRKLFNPGHTGRWTASIGLAIQILFQVFWGLVFGLICPQLPDTSPIFALEVAALINCGLTPLLLAIISLTPNAPEAGFTIRFGKRTAVLKLDRLYRIHMTFTGIILLAIMLCYFVSVNFQPQ